MCLRKVSTVFAAMVLAQGVQAAVFEGKVVSVTEGDIIVVLVKTRPVGVRLFGVDCPELDQPFGKKAKDYVYLKCVQQDVTYRMRGMDRNGNTIAEVQLPGHHDLSQEILKAGFAWWDREGAPKDEVLEKLETEARRAKRGLWAQKSPMAPWDWREERARKAHEAVAGPDRHRAKPGTGKKKPGKHGPQGTGKVKVVCISKRNRHYHRDSCRRLDEKKTRLSRNEAIASGYARCPICRP